MKNKEFRKELIWVHCLNEQWFQEVNWKPKWYFEVFCLLSSDAGERIKRIFRLQQLPIFANLTEGRIKKNVVKRWGDAYAQFLTVKNNGEIVTCTDENWREVITQPKKRYFSWKKIFIKH